MKKHFSLRISGILVFSLFLINYSTYGQGKNVRFVGENIRNQVKLVWIVEQWNPNWKAFKIAKRKPLNLNARWEQVTLEWIYPSVDPAKSLANQIKSETEAARIKAKLNNWLSTGKVKPTTSAEFLTRLAESQDAVKGLNVSFGLDVDMAFIQGFGIIDKTEGFNEWEYGLFVLTNSVSDPTEPIRTINTKNMANGPIAMDLKVSASGPSKFSNTRIKWSLNYTQYLAFGVNGFNVYKLDGKKQLRLNRTPIWVYSNTETAEGSVIDPSTLASEKMVYAVAPVSLFGTEGKRIMYEYLPPRFPEPVKMPKVNIQGKAVSRSIPLSWQFLKADESQITGFYIQRASDKDSWRTISALLPPDLRQFEDKKISNRESETYYYRMLVMADKDTLGMSPTVAIFHEAVIIPPVPKGLAGQVNREGSRYVVNLTWDSPSPNDEDTEEYMIYANSPPSKEIILMGNISPTKGNKFRYEIFNTMGDEYMFRISARGKTKMESKLSDTVKIYVPGNYVLSPSLLPVRVDSNQVTISWKHDYRRDLKGFQIFINGQAVATEDVLNAKLSSYTTKLSYGNAYIIEMIAVNRFGQKSERSFKRVVAVDKRNR